MATAVRLPQSSRGHNSTSTVIVATALYPKLSSPGHSKCVLGIQSSFRGHIRMSTATLVGTASTHQANSQALVGTTSTSTARLPWAQQDVYCCPSVGTALRLLLPSRKGKAIRLLLSSRKHRIVCYPFVRTNIRLLLPSPPVDSNTSTAVVVTAVRIFLWFHRHSNTSIGVLQWPKQYVHSCPTVRLLLSSRGHSTTRANYAPAVSNFARPDSRSYNANHQHAPASKHITITIPPPASSSVSQFFQTIAHAVSPCCQHSKHAHHAPRHRARPRVFFAPQAHRQC